MMFRDFLRVSIGRPTGRTGNLYCETRLNNFNAFDVVTDATLAGSIPFTVASFSATNFTYALSLRLPRNGLGARKGESVSRTRYSIGISLTTASSPDFS